MHAKDTKSISPVMNAKQLNLINNLIFQAKSETNVIKVPTCTYANDVKEKSKYFLCQCSAEEFYPICEGCAKKCHKHHGPALELEGVYICMCGKTNHVITQENEKRFNDKKSKLLNQCFFTKFMEITPNRGIFKHDNKKICSICLEYCYKKLPNSHDVEELIDEETYICKCENHYELNVINLNVDLINKPKFHFHLQNFNFNILSKIPASKQIYLDYLLNKMDFYFSNNTEENSKNFFTNFINYKILELFSTFAVRWENKFFHVKNYLQGRKPEDIIDLLRFKEPLSIIDPSKAPDFVNCKFYYAEYLFNFFVRTYQLKYNNLWNIRTILNMNLYQRVVYLHNIKDFQRFNFFERQDNKEDNYEFNMIVQLSQIILQLYEEILKLNEVYDCLQIIITYVFPTFNRIFKYLIKYNIVDDATKSRYFDAVLDSINLANENDFTHYHGSELYIIKSILYCLIYRNDSACLQYLENCEEVSDFVFCSGLESRTLSKVFINVVNKYDREEDPAKTIIYDYYVRKIFELMIGKNEFFIKNLENLELIPEFKLNLLLQPNMICETIFHRVDKNYMSQIANFSMKMNYINRQYFDYNINYESYLNQVNEIFKDFRNFFYTEVKFLPDLKKKYQIFLDKYDTDNETINRILDLQTSVPYTLFFQKVEEFLHILSEGKKHTKKGSFNISGVQNEYLKTLLTFLFLLVNRNMENLTLLMNTKPTVFVYTFIYVKEDLFNFLEVISEFLFSNHYKYEYDNYYFFTECINEILSNFELTNNLLKNIKSLSLLGRVMKISEKSIRFITMNQSDGLNCIERIIEKLKMIKRDQNLKNLLLDFLINGYGKKYNEINLSELNEIERFIINYISYLNELKFNDIFFLGLIKESDFLFDLLAIKDTLEKIINIKNNDLLKFDVELECQLIKFYLQMSIGYNFKIYEGKKYLTNLLMQNIPQNIETYTLKFLNRDPKNPEYSDLEYLHNNSNMVLKVLKIFPVLFNKILNNTTFNIIEKKVNVLSNFENICLRPIYKLLGLFLSDTSLIKGKESFYIYKIIYYFLNNTVYLYENCRVHFAKDDENTTSIKTNRKKTNEIENALKEEEIKLLNKVEILEYEDICIKGELDESILSELKNNLSRISRSEVKYFQIEEVYKIFISSYEKINKFENIEEDHNSGKFPKKLSTFLTKKSKQRVNKAKTHITKLINLYKEKVSDTYDDDLAMINVLDSMESSDEVDIASQLLYYVTMKLSDSLTDNNIFSFGRSTLTENTTNSKENLNNGKSKDLSNKIDAISVLATNAKNEANSVMPNLKKVNDNINDKSKQINLNSLGNYFINNMKMSKPVNNNEKNNINNPKENKEINGKLENQIDIPLPSSQGNKKNNLKYERSELKDIHISNYKFQNSYCLVFLNLLFFHDSGRFQGILEEIFEKEYEHLFTFLTTDLIFPSVLNEVNRSYELDKLNSSRKSLSYDIASASIKFLQNLCENHNQNFQKKFFNHDFSKVIKIIDYPYKMREEMENEEKDKDKKEGMENFSKKFLTIYKNFINKDAHNEDEENEHEIEHDHENDHENLSIMGIENENATSIPNDQLETMSNKKGGLLIKNRGLSIAGENPLGEVSKIAPQKIKKEDKKNKLMDLKKKEKLKEKHELRILNTKRVSFFNFIGHCERIIMMNLNLDSNSLIYMNKNFKNYEDLIDLYGRFSDLIIEMIQGTENKNFENFYKKLPENLKIFDKGKYLKNIKMIGNFIFIKKAFEIQFLLFEQNPLEKTSVSIKYSIFQTANNVINQELDDKSIINILSLIFPADKLFEVVTKYVKALYVKHILGCDYEDANFTEKFLSTQLESDCFDLLIYSFKANNEIYEDEFFKLASQIFLFLTILGEKYSLGEASIVLGYKSKKLQVQQNSEEDDVQNPFYIKILMNLKQYFKKIIQRNYGYNELNEENNQDKNKENNIESNENGFNSSILSSKSSINSLIITSKFLGKIIYSCEFMIDSPNDEGDDLSLKKIYFIIDPRAYLISKNNIDNFFDTVDRTSSTTKIKSLIDILDFFFSEVQYKEKFLKNNSKSLKWLLEIEYKSVDFVNFCLSMIINIIFLLFLRGGGESELINYLVLLLAMVTIFINCIYLIFFMFSKYSFYISIEKSKLENPLEISFIDRIRIYLITSFLANEEIYLMILNIIISVIAIISKKFLFLFALQLLTVMKFVPTIKEIVIAFKLRISQLASMIAFLGILIFFYASIGFYFFINEFIIDLENGKKGNICKTLLQCWITYFNLGVRSGGGIGDLLGPKPYHKEGIFWLRYFTDIIFFITVILLLLNMINGVIVSTFSQIREESNNKEEDINNKCFVCNIDRMEFEKRKIDFKWHLKHEHNSKTYIKFFICLGMIHEKDLDADQGFILECLKQRDVYIFPVGKCSSIGEIKDEEEASENEEENEDFDDEDGGDD